MFGAHLDFLHDASIGKIMISADQVHCFSFPTGFSYLMTDNNGFREFEGVSVHAARLKLCHERNVSFVQLEHLDD